MSIQKLIDAIRVSGGEHLTVRILCEMTGLKSTSTVHRHLKTLEKRGRIKRVVTYEVVKH